MLKEIFFEKRKEKDSKENSKESQIQKKFKRTLLKILFYSINSN